MPNRAKYEEILWCMVGTCAQGRYLSMICHLSLHMQHGFFYDITNPCAVGGCNRASHLPGIHYLAYAVFERQC
jgi:hypothetical protein